MSDVTQAPLTGLVLSGGGAKGAYQVGVMKALLESGADISMMAGASIGALNGAILACAPSLPEGVKRLEAVWNTLAAESPLRPNIPVYLKMLAATGLAVGAPMSGFLARVPALTQVMRWMPPSVWKVFEDLLDPALMSDEPLTKLMDEYLDMEGLMRGLPLYISIYESEGAVTDILRCVVAEAGLVDTRPSRFVTVQSLPEHERRDALLASAAIPLLYQARQIDDARYSDGGQGGWLTVQGNTPITPLIHAGCQQVIVAHLSDGSLWSRHEFPDTTVLEIRPQSLLTPETGLIGTAKAVLGFHPENIARLMEQGYLDTLHCVGRVMAATQSRQALRESEAMLRQSLDKGRSADAALADAMSRLR